MSRKDLLVEIVDAQELVFFDKPDYDSAIIGVDMRSDRVVYDYDLMITHLMSTDGFTYEEAIEFIDYNTLGAINPMSKDPIILYRID